MRPPQTFANVTDRQYQHLLTTLHQQWRVALRTLMILLSADGMSPAEIATLLHYDPVNQRRYGRDTLRRVAFIRASQHVGIPLATIREALDRLPSERTPTRDDWVRLSAAWRTDLDARIAELQALRDTLTDCIGCGCLSLRVCHLTNPRDMLGREGPGARRLPQQR